jgi:hypothetical protein
MKITKAKLKQIIKEELSALLEYGDPMGRAAKLQGRLMNIAHWMGDRGIYDPEEGINEWIKLARSEGEEISEETKQALLDMSDEIYEYMD